MESVAALEDEVMDHLNDLFFKIDCLNFSWKFSSDCQQFSKHMVKLAPMLSKSLKREFWKLLIETRRGARGAHGRTGGSRRGIASLKIRRPSRVLAPWLRLVFRSTGQAPGDGE